MRTIRVLRRLALCHLHALANSSCAARLLLGLIVYDACTLRRISGPHSLMDAVQVANTSSEGAIWQQYVDEDGRPLGDPFLLLGEQQS